VRVRVTLEVEIEDRWDDPNELDEDDLLNLRGHFDKALQESDLVGGCYRLPTTAKVVSWKRLK
jgi:hypothetical protein